MAKTWKPARAPDAPRAPTTIQEIARRYHACAVALAQTLGLAVLEVLSQHRESVTAIFIECSRSEVRLPAGVKLPLLRVPDIETARGQTEQSGDQNDPQTTPGVETARGQTPEEPVSDDRPGVSPTTGQTGSSSVAPREVANGDTPLPTTIPVDGDLPCRGQAIATLKPAALAMLLAKTAALVHADGPGWAPLLAALQAERARRLTTGQRRATAP